MITAQLTVGQFHKSMVLDAAALSTYIDSKLVEFRANCLFR